MNELNELTDGKNLPELKKELAFQIKNGESEGGTICSHIWQKIDARTALLLQKHKEFVRLQNSYLLTPSQEREWKEISKELFT
jgi:hypothetical protein